MLLLLKNLNDGSVFYLLNKNEFVVGRKDCDLLIQNDQSISRKHAILRIKGEKVTLEDCGAKYNTLRKGEKVTPNVEVELEYNDVIQFGVIKSKYRLEKHNFITTGTRINSSQKAKLKSDLEAVGGQYVESWSSDCSHLTVDEVTLTVKVLHALIDEKPIVRPAYWSKYAENIRKNVPPPSIDNYNNPPIAEALLNKIELKSDPRRKILFKGKLFVFPKEKTKKQMEDIIRKAVKLSWPKNSLAHYRNKNNQKEKKVRDEIAEERGKSISWEKDSMPLEDIRNSPKEFLIVQTPDGINDDPLKDVIKLFSKQGKRTIPLQEIAMSIVLCSCEKDCNPSFNRVAQVFPTTQPKEPTQNNALVPNTQSQYFSVPECKQETNMIIPDTLENDLDTSVPFKNKNLPSTSSKCAVQDISELDESKKNVLKRVNDDRLEENPFKKSKVDKDSNISGQNQVDVKQEKSFLSKTAFPQKRTADESIVKSDETNGEEKGAFGFLNRNKKSKSDVNVTTKSKNDPFKLLKINNDVAQINDENPFKLSIGKKRRETDDISSLSVCKKKKEGTKDRIFSSTVNDTSSNNSANFSKISKINNTDLNSTWMSKDSISNCENIESNLDTEMQKFVDQFKDTVVVEVMAKLAIRTRIFDDDTDGDVSKGKHNYKRFKKVLPLRPQKTIIAKNNFVAFGPGDTTGISDSRRDFHLSDDEAAGSVKAKKKQPKRFFI